MTRFTRWWFGASLLAAFVAGGANPARAQSQTQAESPAAQKYFTDTLLINQDNKTARFYSDLLKDKTVVINSFYASEHQGCTAMFLNLVKVRNALGSAAKNVAFISITVDPLRDTPATLKALSQRFNVDAGWSFITGKKENVELALKKLGMFVTDKDDHVMILIIGNERTGLWKKALAMGRPDEIAKIITETGNDK